MDTSILENIGLTRAEIKVFVTLLEVGNSTAGKIVEKSGLQNAVVHRAFHSLIEKGIITYIYEGKIKSYQAIEPKLLIHFFDEKRAQLEAILPELEAKKDLRNKTRSTMYEGIRGIKEVLLLMIEQKGEELFAYGGSKESERILGVHFWEMYHKKRIENKIEGQLIFHTSLEHWMQRLNEKEFTTVRFTEKDFEAVTETLICGKKVAIVIYLDRPIAFLIEEEKVAESYKEFFKIIWKSAK